VKGVAIRGTKGLTTPTLFIRTGKFVKQESMYPTSHALVEARDGQKVPLQKKKRKKARI